MLDEYARKEAFDVRVQNGGLNIKGEAQKGSGRGATDPREGLRFQGRSRELTPMAVRDLAGGPVKIFRPGVVPQSIPRLTDLTRPGRGERLDRRVSLEKSVIESQDPIDLGLLKHDLGNENSVRIPGLPPGEISAMGSKPPEKPMPKDPRELWVGFRLLHPLS